MVENMRDQALPNGVIINDAYCDRSMTRDYDREPRAVPLRKWKRILWLSFIKMS